LKVSHFFLEFILLFQEHIQPFLQCAVTLHAPTDEFQSLSGIQ
jgi:hypothetical protein